MTSKEKVAEEVAEREFVRMCDGRRIDHDVEKMSKADKREFLELKAYMVSLIQQGRLEVSEGGTDVTYRAFDGQIFTFKKATGSTFLAMETYAPEKKIANSFEALADMAGVSAKKFTALDDAGDVKALMALGGLFLAPQ